MDSAARLQSSRPWLPRQPFSSLFRQVALKPPKPQTSRNPVLRQTDTCLGDLGGHECRSAPAGQEDDDAGTPPGATLNPKLTLNPLSARTTASGSSQTPAGTTAGPESQHEPRTLKP